MNRIIILDENTANQIAAGEVIERPASVVKELAENSIDAGAVNIRIEISKGGISLIRITDDGSGIPADDIEMAFERHGTSKIRKAEDLSEIASMGFRGEALPSIASVANVELNTAIKNSNGIRIRISGGKIEGKQKSSRTKGTTVTVRNLFFNTPARYKFLKSDSTEARYCSDIISRLALAHTDIAFTYISNGTEIIRTPGDGNLMNAVYCIYGREISQNLYKVEYSDDIYRITGFAGNRATARGNRQNQTTFINGRYVKSREVSAAVEKAYETEIMKGKFPFYIINIDFSPKLVDVNVHPAKSEVRFAKPSELFSAVHSAFKAAVGVSRGVAEGASAQARVRREKLYEPITKKSENKSFFSDSPVKSTYNPSLKQMHEEFMDARESFYGKESNEPKMHTDDNLINESADTGTEQPDISILRTAAYKGIMFNTFIMLEINEGEMLLIDQHAAHERIMYERLLDRFRTRKLNSQALLSPSIAPIGQIEATLVEENTEFLQELGFEFDFIGQKDIAIRAVPAETMDTAPAEIFLGALNAISENAGREHMLIEKEAIYTMACKSAVKANTIISEKEVRVLVEQLDGLDNPYTCPHGRPVIVKMTRRELEKLFKRIV